MEGGGGDGPTSKRAKTDVCIFCEKSEKRIKKGRNWIHDKLKDSNEVIDTIKCHAERQQEHLVLAKLLTVRTCDLKHHSECYRNFTRNHVRNKPASGDHNNNDRYTHIEHLAYDKINEDIELSILNHDNFKFKYLSDITETLCMHIQ